jgi:hypothetical protein
MSEEERVVKRGYGAKVEGSRGRGRPNLRWMDSVKVGVEGKVLNIADATKSVHDRDRWSRVVHFKH